MITPDDIDAKEFTTTRIRAGYDPDEVDSYLDKVIVDYRAALTRLNYLEHQEQQRNNAPTQAIPAVYSDMDKLLAVAQQHADATMAEANGRAGSVLAEADRTAAAIATEAQNEKNRILGELTGKRDELQASIATLTAERTALGEKLRQTLTVLEQQ